MPSGVGIKNLRGGWHVALPFNTTAGLVDNAGATLNDPTAALTNYAGVSGTSNKTTAQIMAIEDGSLGRLVPLDGAAYVEIMPIFGAAADTIVVQLWRFYSHNHTSTFRIGGTYLGPFDNLLRDPPVGGVQTVTYTGPTSVAAAGNFETFRFTLDASGRPIVLPSDSTLGTQIYTNQVNAYNVYGAHALLVTVATRAAKTGVWARPF